MNTWDVLDGEHGYLEIVCELMFDIGDTAGDWKTKLIAL